MRLNRMACALVGVLALAAPGTAADRGVVVTAQGLPSADEIVRRAIANDEMRRQHRLTMECDQTISTDRLDESGEVFKSKTKHIVHHEQSSLSYQTDAELSGKKPDGDTVKAEHRAAVMNLRQLAPRFRYTLVGETSARGRECYEIRYEPKPDQPSNSREEKVINALQGVFMIDKKSYEVLEGNGGLVAPVRVALLSQVKKMDFVFHTQTMPNGEAGPGDFTTELIVTAPFYYYHQRQSVSQTGWRQGG